jgi:hypothetical protein
MEIPHFVKALLPHGLLPIIKDSENSDLKMMELNKNLIKYLALKEQTHKWEAKLSSGLIKLLLSNIKIIPGTSNSKTEQNSLLIKMLHKSLLNILNIPLLKFSMMLLK